MTAAGFAFASLWIIAGFGFGLCYFAALRRTIESCGGGRLRFVPAALTLGRIAAAIVFFGLAVRFGSLPLLTAFLGFLMARWHALRAVRRTA
jgi:hypothetical protein